MTNRNGYPTVAEDARGPWLQCHPKTFAFAVIAALIAISAVLGLLLVVEVTVPLIVPAAGWALTAGWTWGYWRRRRAGRARDRRDQAHDRPAPMDVRQALRGSGYARIGRPHKDAVLALLADRYSHEYLTPAELDERQEQVAAARTRADLLPALEGLL